MFTLDQARSFVAVAEELHFGRAAERLNMTQPPLSRQIQKLERTVGVELLERDNRRVALTAAGHAFLQDARRLVVAAERAPDNARRIAAGQLGELRIGFTAASGFSLLGTLLEEISAQMPQVHLELAEMVTGEQVDALLDGDIDLGLARPPFDENLFESALLLTEGLYVAVPSGHRLAKLQREVLFEDLRHEPLIMHSSTKARYFYDLVVRRIEIEHKNVRHTVSQVLTMIALVSAGRGIAFVPESAKLLGVGGVSYLRLGEVTDDPVQLHAIWSKSSRNPALERLVSIVRHTLHAE
ncbi:MULTISPECIES: LysR family transcriptional regulator [Glutamicibacter]|uniref:LysR family transcriptional regulator n=1 Tax=Glutamicibacter TaxID=1742989 RepID=UPI0005794A83|nr:MULTISPECIES: LysR family transcriptional regulator [Glutamicibacter]KWR70382.1 LysR family transcriptional regulator [Arthrobacter sp. W1]WIV43439.1 LysR family transcriptional regulator [Glutamicibacter nicotianae]